MKTVAILPIVGEINPRYAEALSQLSRELAADASVGKVVLYVDSPGGSVSGVSDLAADIRALNSKKPVVAYNKGLMASAAFWISSAASEIVASPSAFTGSLGVVGALYDTSKAAEMEGVKVHVISSHENKAIGFPGAPVTEAHVAETQRTIDNIAAIFKSDVGMGRKWDAKKVDTLFDGRLHPAKEALALGLIDRIGAFESTFTFDTPVEDKPVTEPVVQAVAPVIAPVAEVVPVIATSTVPPASAIVDLTDAEATAMATSLVNGGCPLSVDSIVARLKGAKTIEAASGLMVTLSKIPVITKASSFAPKEPEVKSPISDPLKARAEFVALFEKHKANGKNLPDAVMAASKENPELHKAYIASYNTPKV